MTNKITYRDLLRKLISLPSDRLDDDISIYDSKVNEFSSVTDVYENQHEDVLVKGHLYLKI